MSSGSLLWLLLLSVAVAICREMCIPGTWPDFSIVLRGEDDPDCPSSASVPSTFATAILGFLNFGLGKCNTSAAMRRSSRPEVSASAEDGLNNERMWQC